MSKKVFWQKYDFWKWVRKFFLDTSDILCLYLECFSDSGLSFYNFRIVFRHVWTILSTKNEKFFIFAKSNVDKGVCKGWKEAKKASFGRTIFFKSIFTNYESHRMTITTTVFLSNLMVENTFLTIFSAYFRYFAKSTIMCLDPPPVLTWFYDVFKNCAGL